MIAPPLVQPDIVDPLERRRGFSIEAQDPSKLTDSYFSTLATARARLIRMWLDPSYTDASNTQLVFTQDKWDLLDDVLAKVSTRGIRVVLTVDPGKAGGPTASVHGAYIWGSAPLQDSFVSLWGALALRYNGRAENAGFDICNEPFPPGSIAEGNATWLALAKRIRDAIRAADPGRTIVLQPSPQAIPVGQDGPTLDFIGVPPWSLDNVVWSVHMYLPYNFTHQGISNDIPLGQPYPGPDVLREFLRPVREFQLRFRVPIFIGEFSATRFAPDHITYVRDCAALFKQYGWSWAFHCFRGDTYWNYEDDTQSWQTILSMLAD